MRDPESIEKPTKPVPYRAADSLAETILQGRISDCLGTESVNVDVVFARWPLTWGKMHLGPLVKILQTERRDLRGQRLLHTPQCGTRCNRIVRIRPSSNSSVRHPTSFAQTIKAKFNSELILADAAAEPSPLQRCTENEERRDRWFGHGAREEIRPCDSGLFVQVP